MGADHQNKDLDETSELPPISWKVLQEGATLEGDNGCPAGELPPWLDRERFYKGQQTCRDHFVLALFGSLAGFAIGMGERHMFTVFSSLDTHQTSRGIGRRFLGTAQHLMKWYDTDVLDKKSEGYKSILAVRCYHKLYQKKLVERLGEHPKGHQWLSQTYMSLVQDSMIAAFTFQPYGVSLCSDEELEDMTYFWRVLGYMFGISDRYNSCRDGAPGIRRLNKEVLEEQGIPDFLKMTPEMKTLGQVASDAIFTTFIAPIPIFKPTIHTAVDVLNNIGLSTPEIEAVEKLNWIQRTVVQGILMYIRSGVYQWKPARSLLTAVMRYCIKRASAERLSDEPFPKATETAETFVCPLRLK